LEGKAVLKSALFLYYFFMIKKKDILLVVVASILTLLIQNFFFTNEEWVQDIVEDCYVRTGLEYVNCAKGYRF